MTVAISIEKELAYCQEQLEHCLQRVAYESILPHLNGQMWDCSIPWLNLSLREAGLLALHQLLAGCVGAQ